MSTTKSMSMKELFQSLEFNLEEMIPYDVYDVSSKNVKIKSFNHETKEVEFKRILSVVRKETIEGVYDFFSSGKLIFSCSPAHKVYFPNKEEYIEVSEIPCFETVTLLSPEGNIYGEFRFSDRVEDILDLQVEDNHNYFTNGVLSHNTTTGGNALKFYASQRLDIRKIETVNGKTAEDDPTANMVRIKVVKNKVAPPFKKVELKINFGKGFDIYNDLVTQSLKYNIIQKSGSWFSMGEERLGQGQEKVENMLKDNQELFQKVFSLTQDAVKRLKN